MKRIISWMLIACLICLSACTHRNSQEFYGFRLDGKAQAFEYGLQIPPVPISYKIRLSDTQTEELKKVLMQLKENDFEIASLPEGGEMHELYFENGASFGFNNKYIAFADKQTDELHSYKFKANGSTSLQQLNNFIRKKVVSIGRIDKLEQIAKDYFDKNLRHKKES